MAASKKATGKKSGQQAKKGKGSSVRDLRATKDNLVAGGVRRNRTIL